MLFQSQIFLLAFLPLVLGAFFLLRRRHVPREWMLVVASAVFYGFWDARFLPLIFGQTLLTWLLVRWLRSDSPLLLPLGVGGNLAILGLFKYADFLVTSVEAMLDLALPRTGLILPIGISFYTFQIVSYLVDRRAGRAPVYGMRRFVLYVTFFPQLVAGPIVRHDEFIPQLSQDPARAGVRERIGRGAVLFAAGLVKKVFLADALAPHADSAFAVAASADAFPGLGTAWSGSLAFAFQLFFDFAAYSEMALGLALMMGIVLPINFDIPYCARNLQEFWRRWHMTLSRFLRDYVYIPLGGSRQGALRTIVAVMITMGLCGIWHGAGWSFLIWGLMHGVGLLACRAWGMQRRRLPFPAAWAVTMLFVLCGWVLFRAPELADAMAMFAGMAGLGGFDAGEGWALLAFAAVISVVPHFSARWLLQRLQPSLPVALVSGAALLAAVIVIGESGPEPFIYFQF